MAKSFKNSSGMNKTSLPAPGGINSVVGLKSNQTDPIEPIEPTHSIIETVPIEKQEFKNKLVSKKKEGNHNKLIVKEDGSIHKRKTYIFDVELIEKIKQIEYWDRRESLTEIVNESLTQTIREYEKKNGPLQPIPIRPSKRK